MPVESQFSRPQRETSMMSDPSAEPATHWTLDKRFPVAVIIGMFVQMIVWVWLGSAFYTQTQNNQVHNEERFVQIAKNRDSADEKFADMQKIQTDILIQLGVMNEKLNTLIKKGPNN